MALTKYGYTGTVNQAQWAQLHSIAALNYATRSTADHAPSAVGGLRRLSVAAGVTEGYGVGVVTDAATLIDFAAPAGGAWYLVSIKRDWATPGNTAFVATVHETLTANTPVPTVPPGSYPAVLGSNLNNALGNAGTGVDYEPMFWVWVNNLNTTLVIIDLRTFALNTRMAAAELSLIALLAPRIADLDALPSASGFSEGRRLHVDALNVDFEQVDGAWVQDGVAQVPDAATLATEYAKASGAYLVPRIQVRRADAAYTEEYFTLYNSGSNPNGAASAGWYPISGRLPGARLTRSVSGTVQWVNNAITSADSLLTVTDYARDITVSAGTLIVVKPGRYRFRTTAALLAAATGARYLEVARVTPSAVVLDHAGATPAAAGDVSLIAERTLICAAGDQFRSQYFQNSGAPASLIGFEYGMTFSGDYIGPA